MTVYEWQDASERLKAAIRARFGHYTTFARLVLMEPTQLSATLRPHRRPTVETLDRFSAVLGWPPNELRRWYGYALDEDGNGGDGNGTPRAPAPSDFDRAFDVAEIVALVEQLPGEEYRRRLFAMREGHTDAEWVALCVLFFRAQHVSAVTMLETLERLGGRNQHG